MESSHRKELWNKGNIEDGDTVINKIKRPKKIYTYSLTSNTQIEFENLVKLNKSKVDKVASNPLKRSLSQLTPANVLTIKGYFDAKGSNLMHLRASLYRFAKELNLHIETAFSKDKYVLLVRLKRNWPVGVDKTFS